MPIAEHFHRNGVAIIEYALEASDLARMEQAFAVGSGETSACDDQRAPELLSWLVEHPVLSRLATDLTGAERPARLLAVRAVNAVRPPRWTEPWCQDPDRYPDRPSINSKQPVSKIEPGVFAQMLKLIVHLDDVEADDGPVEALLGSHSGGRLDKTGVARALGAHSAMLCLAARGDILALRPLTIRRQQRARIPRPRRVLQLAYSALPSWAPPRIHVSQ